MPIKILVEISCEHCLETVQTPADISIEEHIKDISYYNDTRSTTYTLDIQPDIGDNSKANGWYQESSYDSFWKNSSQKYYSCPKCRAKHV